MQHSKRNNTWSKWGIFLGVAVALGALVVVGWTFMQNRFQPGSSLDADVTIGIDDMPQSLDIRSDSSAAAERLLVDNVYETLVTVDQDNKLQPGLATSWKTSDDGLTVTLTLQSGVTFSNGHTLDASDAVWSLQQNVTNKVADVDELGDLASVANPNATTVVITLAKPNPTLLRALSGRLGIVYDSESSSADYQRKAIGSGPFTVADFQPGHSLKLARSDTYHGTKAASNVVEFMQYSDADALSKALTDGSLDMAAPVSASTATGLNGKDGLTVKEGATTDKVLLAYNNGTDSLLSDEQARKAFRYQIDAAGIASAQPDAAGALGGPISLLDTPGIRKANRRADKYGPDSLAAQVSSENPLAAQYAQTILGRIVCCDTPETLEQYPDSATRDLPTVNLEVLSDEDYAKRIKDGKWELTVMSMDGTDDAGIFADPDSMFHYDHTEAQQAYADARAATNDADYEARMKAYARLISEDAASDWLYTRKCFTVASTKVSGYPTSMINRRMPLAGLTVK